MLSYQTGNLFENLPTDNNVIIAHIVNNANQMGSGFVVPLFSKWPIVKEQYHKNLHLQLLGLVDFVKVEENIIVANMCAQDNISENLNKRCRYGYLAECMFRVRGLAKNNMEIYAPVFGAGIGGGDWNIIEELIEDIWRDINVTVFHLEPLEKFRHE